MKIFNAKTINFTRTGLYPKLMYPSSSLFPEEPDLTAAITNGDKIVQPIKCYEHYEIGQWYLDIEFSIKDVEWIQNDVIVMVETKEHGEQPFRIKDMTITNKLSCEAWHVGYDTRNYAVELATVLNGDCQAFLDDLQVSVYGFNPFELTSDITTTKSFSVLNMSFYDALVEAADIYNGVLVFDKFSISIVSDVGTDKGVTVAYGKNLISAKKVEDWSLVVTELKPIGNEGITLTPEWLIADIAHDRPYTKIMEFDTDSIENLALVAQLYLDRYKVPRINYQVEAVELNELNIDSSFELGDTIHVKARQFEIEATVLSYDYNILLRKLIKVEFGNYRPRVKNVFEERLASVSTQADLNAQKKIDNIIVKADNITLEGYTTINGGFKIDVDGSMEATSGKIGRFSITNDDLVYTSELFNKEYDDSDMAKVSAILAEFEVATNYDKFVYDFNNDGLIDVLDLAKLSRILEGLDPNPNKQIYSVITIGTTSGIIKTSTIAQDKSVGSHFIMKADKLNGNLVSTKGFATKKMYLNGTEVTVDSNGFLKAV